MDMIMLRFRPIAPKPVEGSASTTTENSTARHAKTTGRGRKKSRPKDNNNNSNNNNSSSNGSGSSSGSRRCNNNGRKRKSSSPDNHNKPCIDDHKQNNETDGHDDHQRADPTLLPLFPEEPDLMNNQVHNLLPFYSLSFDETDKTAPTCEGNYGNCHQGWW